MKNKNKIQILKEAIRKEVISMINEGKKLKIEGITTEQCGIEKNEVGTFWVVENPTQGSTIDSIIYASDPVNFADKAKGGMTYENIKAIVRDEGRARRMGERLLREREKQVAEATRKANQVKKLKGEIVNKAQNLKNKVKETSQAVKSIK